MQDKKTITIVNKKGENFTTLYERANKIQKRTGSKVVVLCPTSKNSKMSKKKQEMVTIEAPVGSFVVVPEIGMPKGFPTHSVDIVGNIIRVGDIVGYDYKGEKNPTFEVIFEENAFRKKYKKWDKTLEKPILEYGHLAKKMRLKIITPVL